MLDWKKRMLLKSFSNENSFVCCIHAELHSVYVCKMRFQNISKPARFKSISIHISKILVLFFLANSKPNLWNLGQSLKSRHLKTIIRSCWPSSIPSQSFLLIQFKFLKSLMISLRPHSLSLFWSRHVRHLVPMFTFHHSFHLFLFSLYGIT